MRLFIEDFFYSNQAEFKKLDKILSDTFTVEQFLNTELAAKAPDKAVALAMLHFYAYHRFKGRVYEIRDGLATVLMNNTCTRIEYPSREIVVLPPSDFLKIVDEESSEELNLIEAYMYYESKQAMYVLFVSNNTDNKRGILSFFVDLGKGFDYFIQQSSIHEIGNSNRKLLASYFSFLCSVATFAVYSNVQEEKNPLSERLFRLKSPSKIKRLERRLQAQGTLGKYVLE